VTTRFGVVETEGLRMKRSFLKGATFGAVVCGMTLVSTAAFAGTGIGSVFNLGTANRTNASTVLVGSTNGQQLRVANNATTGTGVTGIGIHTAANEPPLAVDSKTLVNNLNAALLDGQTSAAFVTGGGRVTNAQIALPISDSSSTVLGVAGFGSVEATCAQTGFEMAWRNQTTPSTALNVWMLHDGVTDFVVQPASGDANKIVDGNQGNGLFGVQVGRSGHVANITTAAHWSPAGCAFQAQAVSQ
jgi:hypothetical protein